MKVILSKEEYDIIADDKVAVVQKKLDKQHEALGRLLSYVMLKSYNNLCKFADISDKDVRFITERWNLASAEHFGPPRKVYNCNECPIKHIEKALMAEICHCSKREKQ